MHRHHTVQRGSPQLLQLCIYRHPTVPRLTHFIHCSETCQEHTKNGERGCKRRESSQRSVVTLATCDITDQCSTPCNENNHPRRYHGARGPNWHRILAKPPRVDSNNICVSCIKH